MTFPKTRGVIRAAWQQLSWPLALKEVGRGGCHAGAIGHDPAGVGPLTFWYATPQCNTNSFLSAVIDGSVVFRIDCSQANPEYQQASIDVSAWADGSSRLR